MAAMTSRMALASGLAICLSAGWASAQQAESLFGKRTASVTYGPYARIEFGRGLPSPQDGYWEPPGEDDPRVDFNLDGSDMNTGAIAMGYDWMNGFRADVSFMVSGVSDVSGGCSDVSNGTPCSDHVDGVDASVKTTAAMVNVFFSPMERQGSNSIFQPFVVGGLGVATNTVESWSRENADGNRPVRSFEGDSQVGLRVVLGRWRLPASHAAGEMAHSGRSCLALLRLR